MNMLIGQHAAEVRGLPLVYSYISLMGEAKGKGVLPERKGNGQKRGKDKAQARKLLRKECGRKMVKKGLW